MPALPVATEPVRVRVTAGGTESAQHQVVTPPRYSVIDHQTNRITSMSSLDAPMVSASVDLAEVEQVFQALAEQWYLDTMPLSSYLDKILHPSYQKILTLSDEAVPLILRELQDQPNDWFWALRILTDDDPVNPEDAGDMKAMTDAWLQWGRTKGHI